MDRTPSDQLQRKPLVVFDWNGTIIDDTQFALLEVNTVITHYGGNPLTLEQFQDQVTAPRANFYIACGASLRLLDELDEVAKLAHSTLHQFRAPLRTGCREVLTVLNQLQIERIVLSNHLVSQIELELSEHGLRGEFSAILANSDPSEYLRGKNKLDRLADFLARSPRSPVIVIGDTVEETQIARHFDGIGIAITGGIHSRERLIQARPDYLIEELSELTEILRKIFQKTTSNF